MLTAKFYVGQVLRSVNAEGEISGEIVKLHALYDPNPDSPNFKFWKATPSGQIELTIQNTAAFGVFLPNQRYEVDFRPVE